MPNNEIIIYENPNAVSSDVRKLQVLNPVRAYLNTVAPKSRNTYFQCLKKLAHLWIEIVEEETGFLYPEEIDPYQVPWQDVTYSHISMIRNKINALIIDEKQSPSYSNVMLAAFKGVIEQCRRLGLITREEEAEITDFKSFKVQRVDAGRAVKKDEIESILNKCDETNDKLSIRDAAIILLLYRTGLRRSELIDLKLSDIDLVERKLIVRHGKGNKSRPAFLKLEVIKRLNDWISIRGNFDNCEWLFLPVLRYGVVAPRKLSDQTVALLITRRAENAGIKDFRPHSLRRSFITGLLENGTDLAIASKLVGHTNISTTMIYDKRNENSLKNAVDSLPEIE